MGVPVSLQMETNKTWKEMVERSAREQIRYPVDVTMHELSVSGIVVRNSRIPALLEDVSETGMRVSTAKRLMTFTSVFCEITVEGTRVGTPTIAQVRWIQRRESGNYSIGLQYLL